MQQGKLYNTHTINILFSKEGRPWPLNRPTIEKTRPHWSKTSKNKCQMTEIHLSFRLKPIFGQVKAYTC